MLQHNTSSYFQHANKSSCSELATFLLFIHSGISHEWLVTHCWGQMPGLFRPNKCKLMLASFQALSEAGNERESLGMKLNTYYSWFLLLYRLHKCLCITLCAWVKEAMCILRKQDPALSENCAWNKCEECFNCMGVQLTQHCTWQSRIYEA